MSGDWITIIDPSVDTSQVSGSEEDKKKVIGYWKIVKGEEASDSACAKVPAGNADDTNDNKITLEAVLTAPVDYSY